MAVPTWHSCRCHRDRRRRAPLVVSRHGQQTLWDGAHVISQLWGDGSQGTAALYTTVGASAPRTRALVLCGSAHQHDRTSNGSRGQQVPENRGPTVAVEGHPRLKKRDVAPIPVPPIARALQECLATARHSWHFTSLLRVTPVPAEAELADHGTKPACGAAAGSTCNPQP